MTSQADMVSVEVIVGRYYSSRGNACAIAVQVCKNMQGDVKTWTACAGGCRPGEPIDAALFVVKYGDVLSVDDAHYYFPDLPIELYRGE